MRLNDLINQELGRYRIEALIGRGGMAAVYRAFDTRLHRHVALKVLYPQYLADDDIVERFRREAITAAQLDHPFIAPIFDVGEANGLIYLAMKLLPGPSLAEVLQREQRLDPQRTLTLTQQIAAALDEAHRRGIVHRDIKPGNVLLDERGQAILTDFGIAKSLDAPSLTESSVIVGTPDYIAPEQIDPRMAINGKIDHRADLYALGALLYRTLTGRRPFDGSAQTVLLAHLRDEPPPPSSVLPALGPSIDAVLLRAMAKQPLARFSSAGELAQVLGDALGDQTEIGVVFPPAALRHDPHNRPTTQALLQPVTSARVPVLPPLEPPAASEDQTPAAVPAVRRRWLVPLLIGVLLLGVGAAGSPLFAQLMRSSATRQPDTAIAAAASETSVAAASSTATPDATATVRPSATRQPSATATITSTTTPSATTTVTPSPQPSATNTTAPAPPAVGGTVNQPRATQRPASVPQPQPTARPTARPTDLPQPTVRPTTQPTNPPPAPTDPPAVPDCSVALTGGFGNLWRTNKAVRDALGCPLETERAGWSAEQIFQGGSMYYRDDSKEYWVFAEGGTWRRYTDVYPSDPEPTEQPPNGLYAPYSGFGRLWQKYENVRKTLGWGTTPEMGFTGVSERFERGMMLFSPAINGHSARIFVLYNNGSYALVRDTYDGP